jgi:predicted nuclease of predicted toxin-antitoxin system
LTLRLYLDDCIFSHLLRRVLDEAGHQVTVPADAGLEGARDDEHFAYARQKGLVLLTRNPDDFLSLHEKQPDHPGLLLVYQDNDPSRDMTARDIVRAIANLLASGLPIPGEAHTLNHWRY